MISTSTARHRVLACSLTACSIAFLTAAASAGVISEVTQFGPQAGTGSGLGVVSVPAIVTTTPNNDKSLTPGSLDDNIVVPIKRFDFNGYIDIEFVVTSSGGVTEYQFFESIDNNTGAIWNGYLMMLGYGVGANFVQSTSDDGLDFDVPDLDGQIASSAFTEILIVGKGMLFGGGFQGTGAETIQFRVDVPDVASLPPGFDRFTLRQVPSYLPEPTTLMLVSLAIAGTAIQARRRAGWSNFVRRSVSEAMPPTRKDFLCEMRSSHSTGTGSCVRLLFAHHEQRANHYSRSRDAGWPDPCDDERQQEGDSADEAKLP